MSPAALAIPEGVRPDLLIALWCAFAALFWWRRLRGGTAPVKAADGRSRLGFAVQAVGYFLAWSTRPGPWVWAGSLAGPLGWLGIALVASAVAVAAWSVRTLGRQWAIEARIVEGHQLVTGGPYAFSRNPIYAAMLGMFLGTALNLAHWAGLLAGLALLLVGTRLRTDREERLLAAEFGEAFTEYRRRTGWLLPGF